ncbi:MAG: hypothetical protein LC799_09655 [Actinobacteria bacterium]|nr:hypothetical protein [Actinomycetota bacterium]
MSRSFWKNSENLRPDTSSATFGNSSPPKRAFWDPRAFAVPARVEVRGLLFRRDEAAVDPNLAAPCSCQRLDGVGKSIEELASAGVPTEAFHHLIPVGFVHTFRESAGFGVEGW